MPSLRERVEERRRAVAVARHLRESEGLSIAQIAGRIGRSEATVKGYFSLRPPATVAARPAAPAPAKKPPAAPPPAPARVAARVTPHHRSQNVTAKDIEVGQVRIPIEATKTILPLARQDIVIVLRGRRLTCRWDPRWVG